MKNFKLELNQTIYHPIILGISMLFFWMALVCCVFGQGVAESQNTSLSPLDINDEQSKFVTHEELDAKIKDLSWKKGGFTITPYGFFQGAAVFDSQRTVPGEFALYVQSPENYDSADWALDARTSRLGLKVNGPAIESIPDAQLRGTVEVDFQGVMNSTRNKGGIQLRKAFVEIVREDDWKLMFGQDWEVLSPLYPQMLVYLPAGFCGNIGYRRGQFRAEKTFKASSNLKSVAQIALCDDFGADFLTASCVSCATSGMPTFEGRYAVIMGDQSRNGLPITVGVSAHLGQHEYSFAAISDTSLNYAEKEKDLKTWSACLDLDIPVTRELRLQGEYYYGENVSGVCGGINQGIDLFRRAGIRDQGYWFNVHWDLSSKLSNNTGYAMDEPEDEDLVATSVPVNGIATARTKNQVIFTNLIYHWNSAFMTGVELSYWQTNYKRSDIRDETPVFLPMQTGIAYRMEYVARLTF